MAGNAQGGRLNRDARVIGLLFASTTSMIGSGWLFGAYKAAKIAGPLSVWSWVAGAVIIMLIALCFAELAVLFPRSGALVHMSHASHGKGLGRIWSWMLFLAYVAVPSVEAEAVVNYANNYLHWFIRPDSPHGLHLLTPVGFVTCAALMGVFAALNLLAVRKLLHVNSTITWWKLAVPVLTIIALIVTSKHWGVWSADPSGYQFSGIFTALPAAGIVFSFLGFRTAIDLAGESSNPSKQIPIAVLGSIVIAAIVYILLQVAFLMALSPGNLSSGWAALKFQGDYGPFAGLAAMLGMSWLATLLYIDAYVSPGGTGLMYTTGGARILFAVGEMNSGPRWLAALNGSRAPWAAIMVMWAVGVLFLLPFPAWQQMVEYITGITVLTYGLGPIVLLVLRKNQPDLHRPFLLKGAIVIAPLAFISSNWIIYWTGFRTDSFLFLIVGIGFVIYTLYYHLVAKNPAEDFGWRHIGWLFAWFGGMWALSAISAAGTPAQPAINAYFKSALITPSLMLNFWEGVGAVAVWSLIVIWLALHSAIPADETAEMMMEMEHLS